MEEQEKWMNTKRVKKMVRGIVRQCIINLFCVTVDYTVRAGLLLRVQRYTGYVSIIKKSVGLQLIFFKNIILHIMRGIVATIQIDYESKHSVD